MRLLLFWGYNQTLPGCPMRPLLWRHKKRGARLIAGRPRRTGPAKKADIWLQYGQALMRPSPLGIAQVMIERGAERLMNLSAIGRMAHTVRRTTAVC